MGSLLNKREQLSLILNSQIEITLLQSDVRILIFSFLIFGFMFVCFLICGVATCNRHG